MATITNKESISTTADQADIFVLSQPGTRFLNRGNLSASGTQASAIVVTADEIIVQNFGDLSTSGLDAPTIMAGQVDSGVDSVTIINSGSILNTGSFADLNGNGQFDVGENFPDGIAYFGTNGLVSNDGVITVPTRSGAGIGTLASDTVVTNSGEIYANIVGISISSVGTGQDRNTVLNDGLIHVTGGPGGAGIWVTSDANTIINEGAIVAEGDEYIGILFEGMANHGENDGTISVSGANSTGVYLYGEGHSFINEGRIEAAGTDSTPVRFGADSPAGLNTGTFTNLGTISGEDYHSLLGSDGDEIVINRGIIQGHMELGGGDDVFLAGRKSQNSGVLYLGAGDDRIVVETGSGDLTVADFVAGAGTDDVIDLSAFRISSFSKLLSHATQDAFWVHIELGRTEIRLVGVDIGSLDSSDFIFA